MGVENNFESGEKWGKKNYHSNFSRCSSCTIQNGTSTTIPNATLSNAKRIRDPIFPSSISSFSLRLRVSSSALSLSMWSKCWTNRAEWRRCCSRSKSSRSICKWSSRRLSALSQMKSLLLFSPLLFSFWLLCFLLCSFLIFSSSSR